jgi:transposase-like protein
VPIRAVAALHDVCESLLFTWRRQVREGVLTAGSEMATFVPVQMTGAPPAASLPPNPAPHSVSPIRSTSASGLIAAKESAVVPSPRSRQGHNIRRELEWAGPPRTPGDSF